MVAILPALGLLATGASLAPMALNAASGLSGGRIPTFEKLLDDGTRGQLDLDAPEGQRFVRVDEAGNVVSRGPIGTKEANYFGGWQGIRTRQEQERSRQTTQRMQGELRDLNERKFDLADRQVGILGRQADNQATANLQNFELGKGNQVLKGREIESVDEASRRETQLERDRLEQQRQQFGSEHGLRTVAALAAINQQMANQNETSYQRGMDRWAIAERANERRFDHALDARDDRISALNRFASGLVLAFS